MLAQEDAVDDGDGQAARVACQADLLGAKAGCRRLVAAQPFTAGNSITLDGQRVTIAGTPAAGDSFSIGPAGQQSIFQTLDDAITTLQQPYQPASYAQGLARVQAAWSARGALAAALQANLPGTREKSRAAYEPIVAACFGGELISSGGRLA